MHAFHEYLCDRLSEKLQKHRVVVLYDPRSEFTPFICEELQDAAPEEGGLRRVVIGDQEAFLACYDGSFFALRTQVEPIVAYDEPDLLLIYLAGVTPDHRGSVLKELEMAGDTYEPRLRQLARIVLLQNGFQDSQIDSMLEPEGISYKDIVAFLRQSAEGGAASILRAVFQDAHGEDLLASWLADGSRDRAIVEKDAMRELLDTLANRIGLALSADTTPDEARRVCARYVLANHLRAGLTGEAPSSIAMIPTPESKDQGNRIHNLVSRLRGQHSDRYAEMADRVESELNLAHAQLDPASQGYTDTFRCEEHLLLVQVAELAANREYTAALSLIHGRGKSFWIERDIRRQAQWEVCQLICQLGQQIQEVRPAITSMGDDAFKWVDAYADAADGWFEVDTLQRRLENWVARMDEEPEAEVALKVVRRMYEELLQLMAEGFSRALQASGWALPGILHQTEVHPAMVAGKGRPVAYFMVDALRYEMAVELMKQLEGAQELTISPAVAALPTITPVGMAALLPEASASFSVIDHRGKIAGQIEGTVMENVDERMRFLKARVPDVVELTLGRVVEWSPSRLQKAVEGASLVVIRSQEIDFLGEADGNLLARQTMSNIIGNLARAVRKLGDVGIESFVITADHGHQFAARKSDDMKIDNPGGRTVGVHRRCWVGHGGVTPPGTLRVTGAELGYDTDLDFVFPTGLGVLKTGGGLSFHHGGISLQELVIPVVSLRIPASAAPKGGVQQLTLSGVPDVITNRTFGIRVLLHPDLFESEALPVRVILLHEGVQVGQAGMAVDADFDRESRLVYINPGEEATLAMILTRDDCTNVRIVVQDSTTDAVLSQSPDIPVRLGI